MTGYIYVITNDVNVPKLHNAAAASRFKVNVPKIDTIQTTQVKICGVLNLGCNF